MLDEDDRAVNAEIRKDFTILEKNRLGQKMTPSELKHFNQKVYRSILKKATERASDDELMLIDQLSALIKN